MGCGASSQASTDPGGVPVTTRAMLESNRSIEQQIKRERDTHHESVKILLLGAGECGKSTILKQMKIMHMEGFNQEEVNTQTLLVLRNTVDAIQSLIEGCVTLNIPFQKPGVQEIAEKLLQVDKCAFIDVNIGPMIAEVWSDPGIKKVLAHEAEFHLLDSGPYFLDKVMETFQVEYTASVADMLRTRKVTTGIVEHRFEIEQIVFKMYDVGGQRTERKSWIHCFDDATAIMFIASLSEYNQHLVEDPTRNRLDESWELFESVINLPWFQHASIILFLNKHDLFIEKVRAHDIGIWHPDYNEGCDYEKGLTYIRNEYLVLNDNDEKCIYVHVTDATNTDNIKFVWKSARHSILVNKLTTGGVQCV